MENEHYISPFKIKKRFDVSSNTLRNWAEKGDIRYIRIRDGLGKRLYHIQDVEKIFQVTGESNPIKRETICYARVSSNHQKEDLTRQIELLGSEYPDTKIISDIGSGLNFKRKGLETLLDLVYKGKVESVVVTYKDRLCRFGSELIEWIFKKSDTKLVVLNCLSDSKESSDGTSELAEDLLAITTVFVARNNGNRSAKFRKSRKEQLRIESETGS